MIMQSKQLYRVREGRKVCGVCLGVAEYFNVDVNLVRVLWLVATICGASIGFWTYLFLAIALPDRPY